MPKLINLSGGIILGEPDEFVHIKLVESILRTGRPVFQGKGFYYEMPGYFALAAVLTKILNLTPIVSLRLISFLSTLATSFLIFFYLQRKNDWVEGLLGGLLYFLIPLTVFYSRIGIIEPLLVFFLTGAVIFFDLGRVEKNWRFSVFSGVFLGLGFLTKYSVLPIFLLVAAFFLFDFIRDNFKFWESPSFKLRLSSFVPLALALLLFTPVLFYFYRSDTLTLKDQTRQIFGLTGETKQELRWERLGDFSWWFSPYLIFLAIVGFVVRLKNFRREGFLTLSFLLMVATVLSRLPFYTRYALVSAPFWAIFAAGGAVFLARRKFWWVVLILVFFLNTNSVYQAWIVSRSTFLDEAVKKALLIKPQAKWIFSNYWPNILASVGGIPNYAWLTYDGPDLRAFAPNETRDALTILKEEGGVIILEDLYVMNFITVQPGRDRAIKEVEKNYVPNFTLENQNSNFPFLKIKSDNLKVYVF